MSSLLKNLLISASVVCSGTLLIAGVKTVTVKQPGTLCSKVGEKNKYAIRAIKIKGALNADDVRFLRDMAGGDTLFNRTPGQLVNIDLSDVEFVPGPESILGKKNHNYKITDKHSIPPVFLYECPVERVVLPARLDSIGNWAFQGTRLRQFVIPEGVYVAPRAIASDSVLEYLRLPEIKGDAPSPSHNGFPGIKKLSYNNVDYVSGGSFGNLPELEEVIFEGSVGHIDGYAFTNCPKLKRILFRGPVASTGGPQFVKDCPELEEVRFDGLVFSSGFGAPVNCPKLKGYTQNGVVLYGDSSIFRIGRLDDVASSSEMRKQAFKMLDYKTRTLTDPSNGFLEMIEIKNFVETEKLAEAVGEMSRVAELAPNVLSIKADMEKSKLELLKESPVYRSDEEEFNWSYAAPDDSTLRFDREYFNLDSIAGEGDDISRIKNLTYWVHDIVRHDGGSYNPRFISLKDIIDVCKKENRGVNCRMMAIMLTEALLAEGIPARYLTCQPKLWKFDTDCHVICMAWSESLGKWIWADPTFAAFVTDENGLMLHPGEVRERLIADKTLVLNPDANWNHENKETKEHYLDYYMAKNLYYITAIEFNRPRPEGVGATRSKYVMLAPIGTEKTQHSDILTSDYDRFWAAPVEKQLNGECF